MEKLDVLFFKKNFAIVHENLLMKGCFLIYAMFWKKILEVPEKLKIVNEILFIIMWECRFGTFSWKSLGRIK